MIPEKLKRLAFALEDRLFDLRHGIDTGGVLPASSTDGPAALHATSYQAVWTRNLRVLLREAARLARPRLFVDIGAGKGKACIYAARRFERVVGVEYAQPLVEAARRNQQRARCGNVEFVLADATGYDLPDEPALVFLFNPFDAHVLARFLARNRAHFERHGSVLAYANDVHRVAVEAAGLRCVFRDATRGISLWR